ncbi:hypothetical protein [Congregibacter sp.]|uniref:hypothetical protein n=1 Tax=Congregibacter sp. TaxID=2744308 RepID=UPI003F6C2854
MSDRIRHPLITGLLAAGVALSLGACQSDDTAVVETEAEVSAAAEASQVVTDTAPEVSPGTAAEALAVVLASQPEAVQARYGARHPAETLEFFGVEPGMTVLEALPGGGWYSKLLAPWGLKALW